MDKSTTLLYLQIAGKPNDDYRISPQSVNVSGFHHNKRTLRRPHNGLSTFAVWSIDAVALICSTIFLVHNKGHGTLKEQIK